MGLSLTCRREDQSFIGYLKGYTYRVVNSVKPFEIFVGIFTSMALKALTCLKMALMKTKILSRRRLKRSQMISLKV